MGLSDIWLFLSSAQNGRRIFFPGALLNQAGGWVVVIGGLTLIISFFEMFKIITLSKQNQFS